MAKSREKSKQHHKKIPLSPMPIFSSTTLLTKGVISVGIGIFFSIFFLYLHTVAPTVTFEDSGDFISSAYLLGIAHPSGYPTYTMIGHLLTYLPLGNIAFRINLFSPICGAITCLCLYFIYYLATNSKKWSKGGISITLAAVTALLFGGSSTIWSQSIIAEVYPLNVLFVSVLILILIKWQSSLNIRQGDISSYPVSKLLLLFAVTYGFSFTNHMLSLFLAPAFIYLFWIVDRRIFLSWKYILLIGLFFILGLLPYIYLPMRSSQEPLIDWGNPTTMEMFYYHVFGKIYQGKIFTLGVAKVLENLKLYFNFLGNQFLIIIGFIGIVGIWRLIVENRKLVIFLGLIWLGNVGYTVNYDFGEALEPYFVPSFFIWAIFLGYGLYWIVELIILNINRLPLIKKIVIPLISALSVLLPIIVMMNHYQSHDKSRYFFAHDYGRNIMRDIPSNSILVNGGDDSFMILWYLSYVERMREDLPVFTVYFISQKYLGHILTAHPEISITSNLYDSYDKIVKNIIDNNPSLRIYYGAELVGNTSISMPYPERLIQQGMVYEIQHGLKVELPPLSDEKMQKYIYRGVQDKNIHKDSPAINYLKFYGHALQSWSRNYSNNGRYTEAISILTEAISLVSKEDELFSVLQTELSTAYNNLGIAYYKEAKYDEAIIVLEKGIKIDPNNPSIHNTIGLCYFFIGQNDNAIKEIKEALRLKPDYNGAKNNLSAVMERLK